jgi:hypothetical protein
MKETVGKRQERMVTGEAAKLKLAWGGSPLDLRTQWLWGFVWNDKDDFNREVEQQVQMGVEFCIVGMFFFAFVFFGGTGVWTQGLTLAMQASTIWATMPALYTWF